ncbi:DUF3426 domain-containing protein [Cupriavidus metallidurans]|jgi:predicted Zn finger-like uncharacterized protein|uniref:DUF3426 domain-containing protein n=1 Tax=Cupriavidus metallidurans TaxID=119219 RepID=UPI0007638EBD|nr:DUF3426 domain-containing protein [Cupriavidus metallidurans]KWW34590.1 hypothetical protein AU374_04125 [Cupriavidus metallidurans]
MAAAKLVTRCPACRTAFRLVADQLRLRQGLVRCGQCDTVFDAREHLIEVPAASAPAGASTSSPASTPTPAPAAAAPSVTLAAALAHAEQTQAVAQAREDEAPFDPGFDPGYDVPALDSPTTMMSEPEREEAVEVKAEAVAEPETSADRQVADTATEEAPAEAVEANEPEAADETRESAAPAAAEAGDEAKDTEAATQTPPVEASQETLPDADSTDVDTPPQVASEPWPALDHGVFDDDALPRHSSLDPAAAFAPKTPGEMPPAGAYSAKAMWPTPPQREAQTAATSSEHSTDSDSADDDAAAQPEAHPHPHTEPVRSASEYLRAADPTDAETEAWTRDAADSNDHGPTSRDGTLDAVARETTTRHWQRDDSGPVTGPGFAPDFLRHTREREQASATTTKRKLPGSRRLWTRVAVVVLGLGVLIQGAYLGRSQLAGNIPVLRPVLEAACEPFGCSVPPWRDLEALRIDTSQLQKQDESDDVYLLAVTMRNQGRATTALPAIELVMTDLQDQLLLRRVLLPADYLQPDQRAFATTGLRAGSELPVRVRFRTQQAAANYRVLIFYP